MFGMADNFLFKVRLGVIGALAVILLFLLWEDVRAGDVRSASVGNELKVHFLDIGQGDAIFIETPEGVQVLIDGGPDGTVIRELAELMPFYDRTIDVLVATHPDADHSGGLIDVLERFEISLILITENEHNTATARRFTNSVHEEGAAIVYARAGQLIRLGEEATLLVLFPWGDTRAMESNASSIVTKLEYGETAVMLTGDAPKKTELELVGRYGSGLRSDILKAGHHGSRTSTAEEFVAAVRPTTAVISAGRSNRYGHPHTEVIETLVGSGIEVASTAESGRLTFVSDGQSFRLE